MKIIKHYWCDKEQEVISEAQLLNETPNIKRLFIGVNPIKNFKFKTDDRGRTSIRYSKRGANLKYYTCLLNHSFAVNNGVMVALEDINWKDYDNKILTDYTLTLIK